MSHTQRLKVVHLYEHDVSKFEQQLNAALTRIEEEGGAVADIQYASDPATEANKTGGFSALIVYDASSPD